MDLHKVAGWRLEASNPIVAAGWRLEGMDPDVVAGWRLRWIQTRWLDGDWDGSGRCCWVEIGMDPDVIAGWKFEIFEAGLVACSRKMLLLEMAGVVAYFVVGGCCY